MPVSVFPSTSGEVIKFPKKMFTPHSSISGLTIHHPRKRGTSFRSTLPSLSSKNVFSGSESSNDPYSGIHFSKPSELSPQQAYALGYQQGHSHSSGSFLDSVKNDAGGLLDHALNIISRPNWGMARGVDEATKGSRGFSLTHFLEGFKQGAIDGKAENFGQLLEKRGVLKGHSALRFGAGLGLDILTDPTTYLFGAGVYAKAGETGFKVAKGLSELEKEGGALKALGRSKTVFPEATSEAEKAAQQAHHVLEERMALQDVKNSSNKYLELRFGFTKSKSVGIQTPIRLRTAKDVRLAKMANAGPLKSAMHGLAADFVPGYKDPLAHLVENHALHVAEMQGQRMARSASTTLKAAAHALPGKHDQMTALLAAVTPGVVRHGVLQHDVLDQALAKLGFEGAKLEQARNFVEAFHDTGTMLKGEDKAFGIHYKDVTAGEKGHVYVPHFYEKNNPTAGIVSKGSKVSHAGYEKGKKLTLEKALEVSKGGRSHLIDDPLSLMEKRIEKAAVNQAHGSIRMYVKQHFGVPSRVLKSPEEVAKAMSRVHRLNKKLEDLHAEMKAHGTLGKKKAMFHRTRMAEVRALKKELYGTDKEPELKPVTHGHIEAKTESYGKGHGSEVEFHHNGRHLASVTLGGAFGHMARDHATISIEDIRDIANKPTMMRHLMQSIFDTIEHSDVNVIRLDPAGETEAGIKVWKGLTNRIKSGKVFKGWEVKGTLRRRSGGLGSPEYAGGHLDYYDGQRIVRTQPKNVGGVKGLTKRELSTRTHQRAVYKEELAKVEGEIDAIRHIKTHRGTPHTKSESIRIARLTRTANLLKEKMAKVETEASLHERHAQELADIGVQHEIKRHALQTEIDKTVQELAKVEPKALKRAFQKNPALNHNLVPLDALKETHSLNAMRAKLGDKTDYTVKLNEAAALKESDKGMVVNYHVPSEIHDAVTRVEAVLNDPERMGQVLRAFHKALSKWKLYVTMANPGYGVRNTMSDLWNAFIRGVPLWAIVKYAGRAAVVMQKAHAGDPEAMNIIREAGYQGILTGFYQADIKTALRSKSSLSVVKHMTNANIARENLGRLMHYLYRREHEGMSAASAANEVKIAHFDYEDLTPFEQRNMKAFIPFYTWTRKNVPLQIQQMIARPGRVNTYLKFANEMEQATGIKPGELATSVFQEHPLAFKTPLGYFDPNIGLSDLARITDPKQLSQMVSPFISVPLQEATNLNFFTGEPLTGSGAAHQLTPAPGFISDLFGGGETGRMQANGKYVHSPGVSNRLALLLNSVPLGSEIMAHNPVSMQKKNVFGPLEQRDVSYGLGLSFTQPNQQQELFVQEFQAQQDQAAALKQAREAGAYPAAKQSKKSAFEKRMERLIKQQMGR